MGRSLLVERALLALLLVVLAPVECGAGPWWGGHRGTRGYGAAGLAGGGGGPNVRPPRITRLEPPKGHVSGGTTLTIRGRGFVRSAHLRVRFADENAVDEVRGTWVSSGEVTCVTPARPKPATTQVTVSNGDGSWSAPPLVYVAGSGTALTFAYDDSPPGCQGCAAPGGFQAALSPWERARETWESDRDSGPDSGGTTVHISSANGGMRLNPEAVCTPSSYIGTTSGHRYWVPNGGPGLGGKVFDVDPTSPGNGPPVTGTFYPSERLTCMFTCPLTVTNASWPSNSSNATNPNSTSGSYVDLSAYHASLRRAEEGFAVDASSFTGGNKNVSSFALTRGVASDAATVSARTAARWIDYTRIACASPPRPTPSISTRTLGDGSVVAVDASRSCVVTVSNDGDVFDDYYANGGPIGGSRDANAPVMPNAAAVPFRYVGDAPTVTSISSRHGVRPEALARLGLPPARGPFAGGTTVTVRGDGFLPGDNLRCRFADDVTGLPPFVADATWVDDRSVTCATPPRAPRETTRRAPGAKSLYPGDGTDPRASSEVGYNANTMNDTIAPCFVANVAVSNDGVAFSDDAPGAKFLYCDVYAAATPSDADPTYPYVTDPSTLAGTPNAPFTDLQSALHAALRGARVDVADGRSDGGVVTVRRSQGPVPRSARWLDKDVVRLAPGVYRGEGNVLLALDAQLVDFVAGDVDDWPDVERGGDGRVGPNAAVDCREASLGRGNERAGGSLRLFASQRVQVGGTPSVKPDGTGAIAGDGAVAFRGVSLEGCFDDAGAGESFADGGAACPAIEGRVAGGCRGDAHYVAPELPGHATGGYATNPDVWETWEYEDEDARYSNEAAWYDYEA